MDSSCSFQLPDFNDDTYLLDVTLPNNTLLPTPKPRHVPRLPLKDLTPRQALGKRKIQDITAVEDLRPKNLFTTAKKVAGRIESRFCDEQIRDYLQEPSMAIPEAEVLNSASRRATVMHESDLDKYSPLLATANSAFISNQTSKSMLLVVPNTASPARILVALEDQCSITDDTLSGLNQSDTQFSNRSAREALLVSRVTRVRRKTPRQPQEGLDCKTDPDSTREHLQHADEHDSTPKTTILAKIDALVAPPPPKLEVSNGPAARIETEDSHAIQASSSRSAQASSSERKRCRTPITIGGSLQEPNSRGAGSLEQTSRMKPHEDGQLKAVRKARPTKPMIQPRATLFPTIPISGAPSHSERRAARRREFEIGRKDRELEEERFQEEKRLQKEQEEEEMYKELRRKAIPRANEVPKWYESAPKRRKIK